jgi:hypothetical protein
MFLEQICPGQVNSHPQAIHTFVYKSDRFIVKKKNETFFEFGMILNTPYIGLCHRLQDCDLCRSQQARSNHCRVFFV